MQPHHFQLYVSLIVLFVKLFPLVRLLGNIAFGSVVIMYYGCEQIPEVLLLVNCQKTLVTAIMEV